MVFDGHEASDGTNHRRIFGKVQRASGGVPIRRIRKPRQIDAVADGLDAGKRELDVARHSLCQAARDRQEPIDPCPRNPLAYTLTRAELQSPMLSMHHDWHSCKPGSNKALDQRSPGMGVDNVRSVFAKQSVQIPDEPGIVAVATLEFHEPDVGRQERGKPLRPLSAADGAPDPARIEPVDQLQDPEFHPARLKCKHHVHDTQWSGLRFQGSQHSVPAKRNEQSLGQLARAYPRPIESIAVDNPEMSYYCL